MEQQNYSERKEFAIGAKKLTRFALAFLVGVILVFILSFYFVWGGDFLKKGFNLFLGKIWIYLIPIIIIHEGLHGLIWAIFSPSGFRSVKFGFNLALMSPYTHCNVPLKKWHYFAGGIAPLIITGLLPALYAFIAGNGLWIFLTSFCTWSSAGDVLSCWYILKVDSKAKILDHPDTLGFFIYKDGQ